MTTFADHNLVCGDIARDHEPWCSPAQHAQRAADLEDDRPGCVGRIIETDECVGRKLGGWWAQFNPRGPVAFAVDRDLTFTELSIEDLRRIYRLLLNMDMRRINALLEFVTAAIVDHDGKHPPDAETPL